MNIQERGSGLLVASDDPTLTPEHPVRAEVRESLRNLLLALGCFEQTTHGAMGNGTIESVARALVVCYERPSAYSISDLFQLIDAFLKANE